MEKEKESERLRRKVTDALRSLREALRKSIERRKSPR